MKRVILPYNGKLKQLATRLRKRMTFSEVKLWTELRQFKMMAHDFDRQRIIGDYIVDFYCKDLLLAIEIDGITHTGEMAAAKDAVRQKSLEAMGVKFLRFDALLVVNNVETVVRDIATWIESYEKEHGVPKTVQQRRQHKK